LAHHTIYETAGGTSLTPGRFDFTQKSKKYQPLDYDQIGEFVDSLGKIIDDLRTLLAAMTDLVTQETFSKTSHEPTPDQHQD
jgi:hypothetical protein